MAEAATADSSTAQLQARAAQAPRSQHVTDAAHCACALSQAQLQPLALLPALDARLAALEGSLSGASRGMAQAAREAGAAAGALARDASAAVAAADAVAAALSDASLDALTARLAGVEAAVGGVEGVFEDALERLARAQRRAADERDVALTDGIVSQVLPPLRAVSMQLLSVAAAAGGAAAGAAAANASAPQQQALSSGPVRAELTGAPPPRGCLRASAR